jgi:hypothetical protein
MNTKKLISMVEFILEIDWLTTIEFCNKYQIPRPKFHGDVDYCVSEIFRIDAVKQNMFVSYAKLLNKDLTTDILIKQFDFETLDVNGGFPSYRLGKYTIQNDSYGFRLLPYDSVDGYRVNKVSDLVSLGLFYNER